jgi:hypothetical protein
MNNELIWYFLPKGLEGYFEIEDINKTEELFKITLVEINTVPNDLPKEYQGKKIINNVLKEITIDSFPVRGRKSIIILKRRYFKFEGIDQMYCRDILQNICYVGTKLDKEFAFFLKELHRKQSSVN